MASASVSSVLLSLLAVFFAAVARSAEDSRPFAEAVPLFRSASFSLLVEGFPEEVPAEDALSDGAASVGTGTDFSGRVGVTELAPVAGLSTCVSRVALADPASEEETDCPGVLWELKGNPL
ncbi:MAG TPA: hypothetical protein VIL63_03945 [Terriglobales bacterium]